MLEAFAIGLAFSFGLGARSVGLPPLVGFLVAGFVLNWVGQRFEVLPEFTGEVLHYVAHWGVLLLLFTVGLKLKIGQVAQRHVVSGGLVHFLILILIYTPAFLFVVELPIMQALLLAIALSFSSTVLAAKILEGKRELTAFHGRTAIGILIIQDLLALVALSIWGGQNPSIWAAGLFLLPLARPLIHRLLDMSGHDELLLLMGMLLALVIGGMGFSALGLSSELGALVMGVMLSNHPRASDVSEALWGLKELFLVGFFLQIGMSGLPTPDDWLFAGLLLLALPLKGLIFYFLLVWMHLRARNAFLAALSLTAYSEFGLIVAAGVPALTDWLVPLALTVALSFAVSAPLNRTAHRLFEILEPMLSKFETNQVHPDEMPPDLSDVAVLVFGMGRTGSAAYDALWGAIPAMVGVDADPYRVQEHQAQYRRVVLADAEDADFWARVRLDNLQVAILAMDDVEAKLLATRKLRELGFCGAIITHVLHEDQAELMRRAGANRTYLTMREAGASLAGHAIACLQAKK